MASDTTMTRAADPTPKLPAKELVVYVPMEPAGQARVTIAVLECDPADAIAPRTMREPSIPEYEEIAAKLVMRHYNLLDQD
jgi:hypothetical protein